MAPSFRICKAAHRAGPGGPRRPPQARGIGRQGKQIRTLETGLGQPPHTTTRSTCSPMHLGGRARGPAKVRVEGLGSCGPAISAQQHARAPHESGAKMSEGRETASASHGPHNAFAPSQYLRGPPWLLKAASTLPHSPHISSRWPPRSATPTRTPRSGALAAISGSLSKGSLPSCDQKRCPPPWDFHKGRCQVSQAYLSAWPTAGPGPQKQCPSEGRTSNPLGKAPHTAGAFSPVLPSEWGFHRTLHTAPSPQPTPPSMDLPPPSLLPQLKMTDGDC